MSDVSIFLNPIESLDWKETKRERDADYRQRPEVRERVRAYRATPEYKERNYARRQTPEYKAKARERTREYLARPEVEERMRAQRSTSRFKAKARQQILAHERLTRLDAIHELIRDHCRGQPYTWLRSMGGGLSNNKFKRYVVDSFGPVSKEDDYAINKAVADWLQRRGIYIGVAAAFVDLMDLDKVEADMKAVFEHISALREDAS